MKVTFYVHLSDVEAYESEDRLFRMFRRARCCPVAQCVRKRLLQLGHPDAEHPIDVTDRQLHLHSGHYELPRRVRDFIADFDNCLWFTDELPIKFELDI